MKHYAKAVIAVIGATLTAVLIAFPDDPDVQKWGAIVSAFLTAVGVYLVPNLDPTGRHQGGSVQPPDRGAGEARLVLCVAAGVGLALLLYVLIVR
ncbi:hypothetical protein [Nocardioides stalactiti]|uniref:hypothetical protein n=1 Tax=Nocardioides stalactiti TaxID=2755356 RepID=UPI0016009ED4|nr:hypothetical protein [Nocardioides stalactiti]